MTKQIDGLKYEKVLLQLGHDLFAEKGIIDMKGAEALWESALDGSRVTETEYRTLAKHLTEYPFRDDAKAWLLGRKEMRQKLEDYNAELGRRRSRSSRSLGQRSSSSLGHPDEPENKRSRLLTEAEQPSSAAAAEMEQMRQATAEMRAATAELRAARRDASTSSLPPPAAPGGAALSSSSPFAAASTSPGAAPPQGVKTAPGMIRDRVSVSPPLTALAAPRAPEPVASSEPGIIEKFGGWLARMVGAAGPASSSRGDSGLHPELEALLRGGEPELPKGLEDQRPPSSPEDLRRLEAEREVDRILGLKRKVDILGPGDLAAQNRAYKRLMLLLHPDRHLVEKDDKRALLALRLAKAAVDDARRQHGAR